MFVTRLISGIFLLAVMIFTTAIGGNLLLLFLAALALAGEFELYRAVKMEKTSLALVGYAAAMGYFILLYTNKAEYITIYCVLCLIVMLSCFVVSFPKYVIEQVSVIFFGFLYIPVLLSYIYQVRIGELGAYSVWLLFICAWGSDTCAYCVGMLIGKHKLPSQLSPKKTIEGCIGGVVGAGLIGFIYATVFTEHLTTFGNPQLAYTVIGCCGSVVAQFGDLAASAIKRNHNVKDYGKLIPGHGGVLDRFDSILFTAPIVYLLISIFRL
ncbi:phosphatidate cytidylyltransferase [Anaeromicropila populeti]|uniref:Phosphatidate cytidylyltransferase n=1 Tax=Anaeromicropila populeti TaxID=37658 RepID=A0A1I6KJI7_9FIRM|nr:phosphatidate cytidylyltransferase [Anaeromicropila populeti]SFR91399.1 phosphatidate cytidylyltransferase [Anaeromicropila populeti]